jgi:ketosteroid isomerase-like protein
MTSEANVQIVLSYFDGCNTGDIQQLKLTLADDVAHFFLAQVRPPIRGAEHLAKYWRKFKQVYHPTWKIDHTIASGNEVVSEWSCAYTLPSSGTRMMFRGTEWYVIRNQRIAEVRAYYQYDESGDCQLNGFPYADRGYLEK